MVDDTLCGGGARGGVFDGGALPDFGASHALLLQGPMGPFFRRFADDLADAGVRVTHVLFNGGDRLFSGFGGAGSRGRGSRPGGPLGRDRVEAVLYRDGPTAWPGFLEALVRERGVDAVFLFGDGRPLHRAALAVLAALGVPAYVFEEGYLRPDFLTLERGGVNGHSSMPRDPAHYLREARTLPRPPNAEKVGPTFGRAAWNASFYVIAMAAERRSFPGYVHHRPLTPVREAATWVRSGALKLLHAVRERGHLERIVADLSGRFFLVPLQVHCDYQLAHSRYPTIEAFVREVVACFAAEAPPETHLVLKHHPMDRPYRDYRELMAELAAAHGLGARLRYVRDLHVPTLLDHALGVVTINSTVGLQSIHHGTPVKVLGDAIYDLPGLTHQGPLRAFFAEPGTVDAQLYRAFRRVLLHRNQANGSFHRRLPGRGQGAGVRWFPGSRGEHSDVGHGGRQRG